MLFLASLSVTCEAYAAKLWMFLDYNRIPGAPNEIPSKTNSDVEIKAAQRAAAPDQVRVFRSDEEVSEYLKTHPQDSFSTLVLSGHSMGINFSGGFGPGTLGELTSKYPSLADVTAFYGLGCYTATQSNARLWTRSLPNLRFFAGFDASGPSKNFAAKFLTDVEKSRRTMPVKPLNAEQIHQRFRKMEAYKDPSAVIATVHGDSDGRVLEYSSKKIRAPLTLKNVGNKACFEKATRIKELLEKPDGDFRHYALGYSDTTPKQYSAAGPFPKGANSSFRQAYALLQELTACDEDTQLLISQSLTGDDEGGIPGIIHWLIGVIHADEQAQCVAVCMQPFFDQARKYMERCTPSEAKQLAKAFAVPERDGSYRQHLIDILNVAEKYSFTTHMPQNSGWVHRLERMTSLIFDSHTDMSCSPVKQGDVDACVPESLWLNPPLTPQDSRCKDIAYMNEAAKNFNIACDAAVEIPLFNGFMGVAGQSSGLDLLEAQQEERAEKH